MSVLVIISLAVSAWADGTCQANGGCNNDGEEMAALHLLQVTTGAKRKKRTKTAADPFMVDVDGGPCSGGTSYMCDAPGWVYCQDAPCSEPVVKNGVLVSECLCWAPPDTNVSYAPVAENAGASCAMNHQNPKLKLPSGGKEMCDAMKKGALVSTYGPKGWKPPLVFNKCPAKTKWAWCWGAPCNEKDGDIICDCPMMISDNDDDQFISISQSECNLEEDPCSYVHNGSPNGKEDIQRPMYWVVPDKSCDK